jgi:CGNR zinc finger/Putative stress-induced transcription regulator
MTLPAWVPSGQLKPAPQPLLLVQAFVNTKDFDLGTDLLAEPGSANDWLQLAALVGDGVTVGPAGLRAAREAREGVRVLLTRNGHGGQLPDGDLGAQLPGGGVRAQFPDADLGALSQAAQAARPELAVGPDGRVRLDPGSGGLLGGGLARLLLIIRDAQQDGTWRRLKVCGKADCQWAFYDRSHSRAGTWCDMASCGNLVKNRNLRARRGGHARPAGPAGPAAP